MNKPRILLVGGGYVGLYAARGLERKLRPDEAQVTLVNPENFMLYRPLLPEVAAGTLEPRHAVVPLRDALRRTELLTGRLTGLDHASQTATVAPYTGPERTLDYDHIVIALGGMTKVMPVPGLAEEAVGFTSIAEAIALRNHILGRLEAAGSAVDGPTRRRAMTFVFVGGGYTGIEALAELHDMAVEVIGGYPGLTRRDLRFVLVEATDRLLPSLPESLARRAHDELTGRGIEVRLETQLKNAEGGELQLSDDTVIESDTLVWVAGIAPHKLAAQLGLPVDGMGRLEVQTDLRVRGLSNAWAAGDCASVPDVVTGETCPPTAQYAVRQGRHLVDNLAAVIRGEQPQPFRYSSRGEFVTLGMRKGVAEVFGHQLDGFGAWLLRRSYYGLQIPTPNRKLRVFLDWTVRLPFGHDVVDLGSQQEPQAALKEAANPT